MHGPTRCASLSQCVHTGSVRSVRPCASSLSIAACPVLCSSGPFHSSTLMPSRTVWGAPQKHPGTLCSEVFLSHWHPPRGGGACKTARKVLALPRLCASVVGSDAECRRAHARGLQARRAGEGQQGPCTRTGHGVLRSRVPWEGAGTPPGGGTGSYAWEWRAPWDWHRLPASVVRPSRPRRPPCCSWTRWL
jgi:hypothetical protein